MKELEPRPPWLDDEQSSEDKSKRKVTFEPTISLGQIISLISLVIMGVSVYTTLDKRVLVLETSISRQDLRDFTQDADRVRISTETREATVDTKHQIELINQKLDRLNDMAIANRSTK